MSSLPSVSTAIWRLRPTTLLPASNPRFSAAGALIDWLSTTAAVGDGSRLSRSRSSISATSWITIADAEQIDAILTLPASPISQNVWVAQETSPQDD